jgi:PII-like signaling protein
MESSILKIYISSTDKTDTDLLYEHIVRKAKEHGLSGATVYRGIMGYGPSSKHINTSKYWELTEKLPVVIELIDSTQAINKFYKDMEDEFLQLPKGCLVTIQPIDIKLYKVGLKTKNQ